MDDYKSNPLFSRSEMLIGEEGMKRLKTAKVAVFGIGGVGSYVVEALVRSGVGSLVLVDGDEVCLSNLNRQLIATQKTLGVNKAAAARERALSINPEVKVDVYESFFTAETAEQFDFSGVSYIVDAVDMVSAKILLIETAKRLEIPVMSSMGAGNKLDPTQFKIADISKTSVCPLAKVMRYELKKRGIKNVKTVFSTEVAVAPEREKFLLADRSGETDEAGKVGGIDEAGEAGEAGGGAPRLVKRQPPGSLAFVPSVAGLIIAGEVVRDIAEI